jgi:hypothetical protein
VIALRQLDDPTRGVELEMRPDVEAVEIFEGVSQKRCARRCSSVKRRRSMKILRVVGEFERRFNAAAPPSRA